MIFRDGMQGAKPKARLDALPGFATPQAARKTIGPRVGVKSGDLPTKFLAWAAGPCCEMLACNSSRLHPNVTPNN